MHRRVWRLSGPVILSNLSIPLLGAVDTAVMGHLPDPAYIGGVAVGALIFSYIYWGFGFLRMSTTGLVAQAVGAGDADEARAILARAWLLAGGLGLLVLALKGPIGLGAFATLEASAQVESLGRAYFDIRVWGAPAALANYVALGWLFGNQRMGAALLLTIFLNGLNIALDLWFVVGLGWGIEGVALATLIAEWSAVVLGIVIILRGLGRGSGAEVGRWRRERILDRGRILALVRVNADIFVRTLCLVSAFAWFTARGAAQGDVVLAANAILLTFQVFAAYGLDGIAHAAEALVGAAVGGRDRAGLRLAVRVSTQWAFVVAGGFALLYLALGPTIIAAMTGIIEVRETAAIYLPWVVVTPLISVWSYQLDGIFIGATRTAEMRNGMLLSLAVFVAAVWLLLPMMGNHGLWLAFMLFMAARGLTLGLWYPRIGRALGGQ